MTGQNDRQDESLTGQALDQAAHCPLTGRYFEPWAYKLSSPEKGGRGLSERGALNRARIYGNLLQ